MNPFTHHLIFTPMSNNKFAQGRPATGRTFAVSVRITKEAADILNTKRNKSEYIDHLIKQDERVNTLLHSGASEK